MYLSILHGRGCNPTKRASDGGRDRVRDGGRARGAKCPWLHKGLTVCVSGVDVAVVCVCVCVYLPSIGRCAPGTAIAAGPCRGTMRTSCRRSRAPVLRCSVYPSHPSGALQPAEAELQLRNSLRATAPCTRRGGRRLDCCHLAIQARTRRQRARVPRELRRVPPFRGRPIAASAGTSGTRRCAGAIA